MKILIVIALVLTLDCASSFFLHHLRLPQNSYQIPSVAEAPIQPGSVPYDAPVSINGNVFVQIFNNSELSPDEIVNSNTPGNINLNSQSQSPTPIIPDGYSVILKGGQYTTAVKFHPTRVTWNEARKICLHEGGFLAYPSSTAEENIYRRIMTQWNVNLIWTGIHSLFEKTDFATVLGEVASEVAVLNWGPGEPNNQGDERCVDFSNQNNLNMNDVSCASTIAFLCKIKMPQSVIS